MNTLHVIKLGGSLMDLADLRDRFEAWRATLTGANLLLIVGGGVSADVVRDVHKKHGLTEAVSHGLAVHAMDFNAHVVCAVLGEKSAAMAINPAAANAVWASRRLAVVSPVPWLMDDERQAGPIPQRWSFTSDSVSAYIATRLQADRLTLLKSTLPRPDQQGRFTRQAASDQAVVDPDFPLASASIPEVYLHNLRGQEKQPTRLE
jgi:aspartokinase-like uncharacterized kinase